VGCRTPHGGAGASSVRPHDPPHGPGPGRACASPCAGGVGDENALAVEEKTIGQAPGHP
jgi:hypothetical protein